MANYDEVIRLIIETSGDQEVGAIAQAIKGVADSSSAAAPQAQALLDELSRLGQLGSQANALPALKANLVDLGTQLEAAKAKAAELQAQFDATTNPSARLTAQLDRAKTSVSNLEAAFGSQTAAITKSENALAAAGVSTQNLDAAQRDIGQSFQNAKAQAESFAASTGTVAANTELAAAKAEEGTSRFGELGKVLAEVASIAAVAELALKGIEFGADSLKNAEAVEASLSRVKALAQGTAEEFAGLDDAITAAARAANVTDGVASTGLAALASQGLAAKDAIAALTPTLLLAKIANTDVGTAAAQLAGTLKAFNVPAADAAQVVDELTVASHGAAGGLAAMAAGAAELAPDAKSIGLDLTQTVSVLGLLSSQGLDASKSVRGLRTVFQDLQNPTSALRGELLALGDGTSSFSNAVTALTSGSPRARDALLTLDGPTRTIIEALGNAGPAALSKFTASLQSTSGAAATTAAAIDDNLSGAATRFENAIESIGAKLAGPILKPFTDELNKLAGELNDFAGSDDFKSIQDSIASMAQNAAKAIDKFVNETDFKTFTKNSVANLQQVSDKLGELAGNAQAAATAINKTADFIGAGFHTLGTAVDGVVAGAAKAGSGIVSLAAKVGDATGTGKEFHEQFDEVGNVLDDVGNIAATQAGEHFDKLKGDVSDLAGASDDAAPAIAGMGDAAKDAAPKIQAHADATQKATQVGELFKNVVGGANTSLDAAGTSAQTFSERLKAASTQMATFKDSSGNALDPLKTAFSSLGIQSQEVLAKAAADAATYFHTVDVLSANTAEGLIDRQNAFLSYAQKALAASAGLDEGQKQSTREQLEATASTLGLTNALKVLENQSSQTGNALLDAAKKASEAVTQQILAADKASAASFNAGTQTQIAADNAAAAASKAEQGFTDWGDAADAAALKTQGITADTSNANKALNDLSNAATDAFQNFQSVSEAAGNLFTKIGLDIGQNLEAAFGPGGDTDGFAAAYSAIAKASQEVQAQIDSQRASLAGEIASLNQLGQTGQTTFGAFGNNATTAAAKMADLSNLIASGNYDAGLLGQNELQPLQAALDAARQRVQALADATKQADAAFNDVAASIQEALDEAAGNDEAIEARRHAQQLADLEAAAKAANQLNSQTYQQAVANENALHALKEKNIQDEAASQKAANGGSGGSNTTPDSTSSGSSSSGASSGGASGAAPAMNFDFSGATFIGVDQASKSSVGETLARIVQPQLQAIANRSR